MARQRVAVKGAFCDTGITTKNGPNVNGASTPRFGPNAWIGGAEMNCTATLRTSPRGDLR